MPVPSGDVSNYTSADETGRVVQDTPEILILPVLGRPPSHTRLRKAAANPAVTPPSPDATPFAIEVRNPCTPTKIKMRIADEKRIKPSALQRLDKAGKMLEVEIRVRIGARIAPPTRMDADRPHECAEMQLFDHGCSSPDTTAGDCQVPLGVVAGQSGEELGDKRLKV